jgi:methionyl-tRNA formyltransferase
LNTSPELRLGVAGTPEFAVPALQRLAEVRTVAAVFTQPDRPAGRGLNSQQSPVKRRALELGIAVHQPPTLKSEQAIRLLETLDLDVLIVVAYGLILPPAILKIPRLGCINIHASLLPRWRGAAPIQRALLAGDTCTGVTIMRMEAGLDTGPMLAQRSTPIADSDTGKSLHDRLANLGASLMVETLPSIESGSAQEVSQPDAGVTYAQKIGKEEARIDWSRDARSIWHQVRAFNPWPVAETRFDGQQLRIWEAELAQPDGSAGLPPGSVLDSGATGVEVVCGKGILRITRLQLAGRKPLPPVEFLSGQRLDGARFD